MIGTDSRFIQYFFFLNCDCNNNLKPICRFHVIGELSNKIECSLNDINNKNLLKVCEEKTK